MVLNPPMPMPEGLIEIPVVCRDCGKEQHLHDIPGGGSTLTFLREGVYYCPECHGLLILIDPCT